MYYNDVYEFSSDVSKNIPCGKKKNRQTFLQYFF